MRRDPWRDSCPEFSDLMYGLSRLKLSARLCNLGLNPDAARPLARLMFRLSRPYVQTLQTQTLGATMQFGSNPDAARPLARLMSRVSRPSVQTFQTQTLGATMQFGSESRCGATCGATMAEKALLSRPRRRWCGFPDQVRDGAVFQTNSGWGVRLMIWSTRSNGVWFSSQIKKVYRTL